VDGIRVLSQERALWVQYIRSFRGCTYCIENRITWFLPSAIDTLRKENDKLGGKLPTEFKVKNQKGALMAA
jgi:hypothetical protein